MPVVLFYGIDMMTLVQAPFYAWLLMVSAWERRRAALWAFLPLWGFGAAEDMVFGRHPLFHGLIEHLFIGPFARAFAVDPFLFIAIRLRRDRELA